MTFEDLNFEDYPEGGNNSVIANVDFDSGWTLRVVRFAGAEGFELERYEVTTLRDGEPQSLKTITNGADATKRWIKPYQITQFIEKMPVAIARDE